MQTRWSPVVLAAVLLGGPVASAAPTGAETVALAGAQVSDDAFDLKLRPVGEYRAGQAASAEIVLDAKGGYKVNDKYPTKFKFDPTSQVRPHGQVVGKDALEIQGSRAVMTLRFTPESAGKKRVAGEFKFSVCTNDRCLVEKRDLTLTVTVH